MKKSVQILTPRSREWLRTTLQASAFSVAALSLPALMTAQPSAPSSKQSAEPAGAAEVEKVKNQLLDVDTRIRAAEQKAMRTDTVREKRDHFDKTLRTAMVKEEPKAQALLERQDALVSELAKSDELTKPAEQRSPEFQERFQEYKKLSETLSPIAQRTSEKPEVAKTYEAFRSVLTSEMTKVEPAVPQLIAQRGELMNKYQQLMRSGHD